MRTLHSFAVAVLLALLTLFWNGSAVAAEVTRDRDLAPGLIVPDAARPGPQFSVEQATQSYVDLLDAKQRAQSDAYFEGGYWISLWQLLVTITACALLLFTGASQKMRDWASKLGRWRYVHTALYAAMFIVASSLLTLPWDIYVGFWREHEYGLATQSLGEWLGDGGKGLLVGVLLGAPLIGLLYMAVRRAGNAWWAWAGGICAAGMMFAMFIAPVYISPMFNTYTALPNGELRDSLLAMARSQRIPASDIYVFDASKQTTRISANVSGFASTTRISLNDNLLKRTSEQEIRAVMGHEMGHYVLNHSTRLMVYMSLVLTLGFLFVHLCFDAALKKFGSRWGIEGRGDAAGLPLAVGLLSLFMTVMQPVNNSIIRQAEAEADAFGLAVANEPHGFATSAMRLSTYRKIHPGKWEEILFYDHPSGYNRVQRSMSWLQEHADDKTAQEAVAAGRAGR